MMKRSRPQRRSCTVSVCVWGGGDRQLMLHCTSIPALRCLERLDLCVAQTQQDACISWT